MASPRFLVFLSSFCLSFRFSFFTDRQGLLPFSGVLSSLISLAFSCFSKYLSSPFISFSCLYTASPGLGFYFRAILTIFGWKEHSSRISLALSFLYPSSFSCTLFCQIQVLSSMVTSLLVNDKLPEIVPLVIVQFLRLEGAFSCFQLYFLHLQFVLLDHHLLLQFQHLALVSKITLR